MTCADVGALRAYLDDELSPAQRSGLAEHLAACAKCRREMERISAQAAAVGSALECLAPGPQETVVPAAALRAWRQRAAAQPGTWQKLRGGLLSMGNGSFLRGWSAALASAVVLAIVASLLFTPVGAAVSDLLSVFRAEKFAPVTIDPSRPPTQAVGTDPRQFGEFELRTQPEHREVASVGEAQGLVDFPVRQLANGPAGLAAEPRIYVSSPLESVFTFDLAKTEATLAEVGVTAQLPAELDGATVRIYVPTNVQQMYVEADGTKSGLVLAQGRSPTLELPAILDTPQMRELFFTLSGLPPELVDQLRAITDTRTTVPVPVLEGDTSREVAVDGTQGLLVTHRPPTAGADAPEGSYLVWQKDGIVYALGGTVTEAELLAAAESLSP